MSPSLHDNFPKLAMQFVSLSLQIAKLCRNQFIQTKMLLFYKMFHLNAKQFYVLDFIFDVGQYRVRPTAHWKEVKKWYKAITTTSVTTVIIDSSLNPFREASYA